ncbi:MAG: formate dehydrogenase subunit alpha [Gammaproteobacteria bacterium]
MTVAIEFTLDGRTVSAEPGETILQAAQRAGVTIPHLCYRDGMRADANCRACMVEIEGERVLAPACRRRPEPGMKVRSASGRARHAQRVVVELLASDLPGDDLESWGEVAFWARELGIKQPRFPARPPVESDRSHPAIDVNLAACIHCTRCLRACREVQVNDVIGFARRGAQTSVVFDMGDPMGLSSCVGCGECVQACPTGALRPASLRGRAPAASQTDSVCPYCGVGCLLTYHVAENRIVAVEGRDGPSNRGGRLCVKGRFGQGYVHHPQRLAKPLIRLPEALKDPRRPVDPADPSACFREASWEEALEAAAAGLRRIRDRHGPGALAGFGSAKGSNEEAYLFQKLVRTGFGTNNVDHCTRLCHASSVAALLEGIGSGAVSNPVADVAEAEVILVIGANPTANHPVAATFIKNAAERGATLIVMDPRETELARHADYFLQFHPDTDVALLNALLHTIVEEVLFDADFVARRTSGFEALREHLKAFSPEAMAPICGIDAGTIRAVARRYATSRASMILWGMGISQHVHGTDNARCLIALALVTGQIGRRGTGLHPLRGQNNVQGASDAGLIPMVFPDYQRVDDAAARARFEALWGVPLDARPGLTVVEILEAARRGDIRGMYIMGENPALSDPDALHAREALASLEHLVVQDIFLTETAALADVVLPASAFPEKCGTFTNTDRRVQLGRQALEPPGEARQDLWIIQELARRLGLAWDYPGPEAVFEEMRRAMPSIAGITWERLERDSSVTYPCRREGDAGEEVIFTERFPTADGLGRLVPATLCREEERIDESYPEVLITGRILEHWHTGSMTRRSEVLDALRPEPEICIHPDRLAELGLGDGDPLVVESRRGSLTARARSDTSVPPGTLFMPFCYYEAAANLLTSPALDPVAKIPEFKYSAVQVRRGDAPPLRSVY